MRLLVFEKINRYIWVSVFNRLDPKNDKPVKKKKPILKSSPAKSTPKQRQTHVRKFKVIKKSPMYGKQFYVKKQTRPSKSDPGPQRTPILPTRREFAGNPKFLHYVDAKIT